MNLKATGSKSELKGSNGVRYAKLNGWAFPSAGLYALTSNNYQTQLIHTPFPCFLNYKLPYKVVLLKINCVLNIKRLLIVSGRLCLPFNKYFIDSF